jgi:hypothetical protein
MSAAARAAAETPKATVSCTSSSSTPGTQATPRAATSAPRPSSTPAPSAARPRLTHRRRSNLPARPTLDGLSRQPGVLDLVLQNLSFRDLLAFSGTCRKYQAHVRANLRNLVISGRIIEGSRKTTLHFGTVSGYRLFSAPLDSCVRECVGRIRSARALDVITYLKRHCGEVTLTINGHVPSSGSGYHLLAELIALLGDRIIYQKYEPTLQGSMLSISFGSRDVVLADNWRTSVPQMAVDGNSVVENLIYPITGAEGSMKSMTMVKKVRHLVLDFTHWSASNAYARADQAMATTPNSSSPSPSRLQRIAHYAVTALRNGAKDVSIAALDEVDIEWLDPALVPKDGKRAPHVHLSFTRAFRSECDRMRRLNMLPNLNTNTNTGVNFYYRGHDFLKRFQSLDNE